MRLAFSSFIFLTLLVLCIFIWAYFLPDDVIRINLSHANIPPMTGGYLLGTDSSGRDMLNMLVLGARNSLVVAIAVTCITFVIGALLGLYIGFYGGRIDNVVMRFVDIMSMIPTLMVIIVALVSIPERTTLHFIGVMSIFGWIGTTRVVRTRALQQRGMMYVQASRVSGTSSVAIMFREVLPNIMAVLSSSFILGLASNIGIETGLTIIGFGLAFDVPSLGGMIAVAMNPAFMVNRSWQWLPALVFVMVFTLSAVFVGQAFSRSYIVNRF